MRDVTVQEKNIFGDVQGHLQEMPPFLPIEHGRLIVLEGIDLSGRTTQVQLLYEWLTAQRYRVTPTAWRTSPLISEVLAYARKQQLQPLTYSMLYCADHLDRTQHVIKPALQRGEVVLADRYTYTAFARDEARGLDRQWLRNLYSFTAPPDIVFYLHISPEEAVRRRLALLQQQGQRDGHKGKQKKAGKSTAEKKKQKEQRHEKAQQEAIGISTASLTSETLESFRRFEVDMYSHYQRMQQEFDFTVIDGNQSIEQIQLVLRRAVTRLLLDL